MLSGIMSMEETGKPDLNKEELERRTAYFANLVTDHRLSAMQRVLKFRTRYITIVLENIYQPHNASAVLRSCDAFGIQDVHIIENSNTFTTNSAVDMGTSQWLTLHRYRKADNNTRSALISLKERGYRIAATSPHTDDVLLEDFDLSQGKTAFLFGTELDGLTDEAMELADEYVRIPMFGFVESFNISVSCALTLHHLAAALHQSKLSWHLDEEEKQMLLLKWLMNSVRNPELHERRLEETGRAACNLQHDN
jgi:tRNA (guanosine-2'-O-)-methyltransferase